MDVKLVGIIGLNEFLDVNVLRQMFASISKAGAVAVRLDAGMQASCREEWSGIAKAVADAGLGLIAHFEGMMANVAESVAGIQDAAISLDASNLINPDLLQKVAAHGRPIFLQTDGLKRIEIYEAIEQLKSVDPDLDITVSISCGSNSSEGIAELRWFVNAYKDLGVKVSCRESSSPSNKMASGFPEAAMVSGASCIEKRWSDKEGFGNLAGHVSLSAGSGKYPLWNESREECRRALSMTDSDPAAMGGRVGILLGVRVASTRLPQKALLKICGVETIALLLERLMHGCNEAAEVILCFTNEASDDPLCEIADRYGINYFRGSTENVAQRMYFAMEEYNLDHMVRVTGDDLLRAISLIDEAISLHLEKNADYTVMDGVLYGGDSEIVSRRAMRSIALRSAVPETEYLTFYLDDPSAFVQARLQAPEIYDRDYRLTLDTAEDLKVFERIFEALHATGKIVTLQEAIAWLDDHPEVAQLNNMIMPKLDRSEINTDILI